MPTLRVFEAYPRITEYDPAARSIAQRAAAIKKAMTEIRKRRSQRHVADAVNTTNGPSSATVHSLPLHSNVLIWREGNMGYVGQWTGPYRLLAMDKETCAVEL